VHFEVIQDWVPREGDYDQNGDGDLTLLAERDDIRLTAVNSNADIDVYLVHRHSFFSPNVELYHGVKAEP